MISQKYINSNFSLLEFFELYKNPNYYTFSNESAFLKHNFFFFLISNFLIKIFSVFPDFFFKAYILEFIIASIPGFIFFLTPLIIYNAFKKAFDKPLLYLAISFFWLGSYLINFFSSSAFAESYIFFFISINLYILNRKKNLIIFLPIIHAILIQIRLTCWFIMPIFIWQYFKNKPINLNNIIKYLVQFLGVTLIFKLILNELPSSGYFLDKVLASFCSDDLIQILSIYFKRIFQTFFSFSMGLLFIFPALIVILYSYSQKFTIYDVVLLLCLIIIISLFALEEYWFLPAGISGNRGIAPFLILLFPNFVKGLETLVHRKSKITIILGSICILLFLPSLYYRTTISLYAVCGQIEGCSMPFRNNVAPKYYTFNNKKIKCRVNNSFAMFNFKMHPGIYAYRVFNDKLNNKKNTTIYLSENRKWLIDSFYIVPETIGSRLIFLLKNNLQLTDNSKINFKNKIFPYKNYIINIIIFLKFVSLLLILIFLIKTKKN